jgi:hemerythrin superfamily protein
VATDLHRLLSADHERLDALLRAALRADGAIDEASYAEFRRGLLRHIGIEEKILFPLLRQARRSSELEAQLHRDHAVLAALLVPPPARDGIARIRQLLEAHNLLEEEEGGLYEVVESITGSHLAALMERVHATPEVPVTAHVDKPVVRESIEQLWREAWKGRRR